jgi:hypothetical protein
MIQSSNGRRAREAHPQLMIRLKSMGVNALDLASSMAKLASLDFNVWRKTFTAGFIWIALALAFVLGAIPVLGHGLALFLQTSTGITLAAALTYVAGAMILVGGALAWWAWRTIDRSFNSFENSREELQQNLAWLRGQMSGAAAAEWDEDDEEFHDPF